MRIRCILFWRQKIFVAFSFVVFTTTIFRDSPGIVDGLFLLHNGNRNFNSFRGGFNHKNDRRVRRLGFPVYFSDCDDKKCFVGNEQYESKVLQSRGVFLRILQNGGLALTIAEMNPVADVRAFEGGVGGLGKTKPETGVELFDETSTPIQNDKGIVSSEIKGSDGSPILVSFQTPWPLLPTSGALEARDIRSTESAFVQVVSLSAVDTGKKWKDKKEFQYLLMDSVFGAKGKFGAYGQPFDIQVKKIAGNQNSSDTDISEASLFTVTFTTLTPAMRESERKAVVAARQVGVDTLILLVVTTTSARYPSNEKTFQGVASSFEAIAAPESNLNKRSSVPK